MSQIIRGSIFPVDETTVCIKFKISNEHKNVCKVHFCHECGKAFLNKNNLFLSFLVLEKWAKLEEPAQIFSRLCVLYTLQIQRVLSLNNSVFISAVLDSALF